MCYYYYYDDSLIEVMDVGVGCDDNVSLHTQPSTEEQVEQVRGDDCHARELEVI